MRVPVHLLLILAGCNCTDAVPTAETRIATQVSIPGKWELDASPTRVVLRTTQIANDALLIKEESDFRHFFTGGSTFASTRGRVATAWEGLGGGTDAFVISTSEGDGYETVGYWPNFNGVPVLNCRQGPAIRFTGSPNRPMIYVVGYGCDLACPSAGRDVAWFVGDAATRSFTKHCATETAGPQTVLRSPSNFIFWDGAGAGTKLRVVRYLPEAADFETIGERLTPDGVTDIYGVFEDGSILAVTSFGENSQLVEFGLDGGTAPSRFGSMPGFFLQSVRAGPDGSTWAFGTDVNRKTVIKRSEREKRWVRSLELGSRAAVEMAVGPQGPVVVSLDEVDAGIYDVYIQRFEP